MSKQATRYELVQIKPTGNIIKHMNLDSGKSRDSIPAMSVVCSSALEFSKLWASRGIKYLQSGCELTSKLK